VDGRRHDRLATLEGKLAEVDMSSPNGSYAGGVTGIDRLAEDASPTG
jgi:hypothetical protein